MVIQFQIYAMADQTFSLVMGEGTTWVPLQHGFASEQQALEALAECLTYKAPDVPMEIYDKAVEQLQQLTEQDLPASFEGIEAQIAGLADTVQQLQAGMGRTSPPAARFLGQHTRQATGPYEVPAEQLQPRPGPSIRRVFVKPTIEQERESGNPPEDKIAGHKPYGGVSRRGGRSAGE